MDNGTISKLAVISVVFALFAAGAVFNSVMDVLQFRYSRSVFADSADERFFNPKVSWRNKWEDGDPAKGEAYPGSSTVFVLFTDAWHLAQFLMFTCFELAVVFLLYKLYKLKWYWLLLVFLAMKLVFGLVFELFFAYVLV